MIMIITIAILSLLGMVLSIGQHAAEGNVDCNLLFPAILTIVLWETNLTLSIITICVTVLIAIIGIKNN
jgi:hypothetical protein